MAEKALTAYEDDIEAMMPKVLMVMMGLVLLMAVLPAAQSITQSVQAQAYQGR
ncbi:unnamed protein product, partial [marine sediment metagenome]